MLQMTRAVVVLAVALATHAEPRTSKTKSTTGKPNIVWMLADDLNYDLVLHHRDRMPNLQKYLISGGLEFSNHVAVAPVCGPSRSSLLAGRFVHNTGYVANAAIASIDAFSKVENNTIGSWLRDAGYYTAFLGKYVNGMECHRPSGWRHWGGLTCSHLADPIDGVKGALGGTYNFYNSSQWQVEFAEDGVTQKGETYLTIHTGEHQGHFLGQQVLDIVANATKEKKPFFVHVTPLMTHYGTCYGPQPLQNYAPDDPFWERYITDSNGYKGGMPISPCPTVTRKSDYDGALAPHYPSWNESEAGGIPVYIQQRAGMGTTHECCSEFESTRQHMGFRNRSSALLDLDDMIGHIISGLESMSLFENTFFFFTADNGYHLGEHKLLFGKSEPYETDIRLPMFVTGPGVGRNQVRKHPTNHIDITATIVELAGAVDHVAIPLDGLSFVSALDANAPSFTEWRTYSFTEFYVKNNTWWSMRHLNETDGEAEVTFHWWCNGQAEVFHKPSDPYEMKNLANSMFGRQLVNQMLPLAAALGSCAGSSCRNPDLSLAVSGNPLPCHDPGPNSEVDEAAFDP